MYGLFEVYAFFDDFDLMLLQKLRSLAEHHGKWQLDSKGNKTIKIMDKVFGGYCNLSFRHSGFGAMDQPLLESKNFENKKYLSKLVKISGIEMRERLRV